MARKMWKDFERTIRDYFRGIRIPVSGQEKDGRDVESKCGRFDYQVKRVQSAPKTVRYWLDGIRRTAAPRNRIGLVVIKAPGEDRAESMVILQACDWLAVLDLLELGDDLAAFYAKLVASGCIQHGERVDRALVERLTITLEAHTNG